MTSSNDRATGSRIASAQTDSGGGSKTGLMLALGIVGLVIAAGLVAILLSGGGDDETATTNGGDVGTEATAEDTTFETNDIQVEGTPLPGLAPEGDDGAVGSIAPTITGTSFDGTSLAIENDGRPKLIAFLAHWCPHCQREVPAVQSWLDERGGDTNGVDLYAVSTAVDTTRDNFPPSAWLEREGWTIPTVADSPGSEAANAFGLTGFPFWVAVDADGDVLFRASGEQPTSVLDTLIEALAS